MPKSVRELEMSAMVEAGNVATFSAKAENPETPAELRAVYAYAAMGAAGNLAATNREITRAKNREANPPAPRRKKNAAGDSTPANPGTNNTGGGGARSGAAATS